MNIAMVFMLFKGMFQLNLRRPILLLSFYNNTNGYVDSASIKTIFLIINWRSYIEVQLSGCM